MINWRVRLRADSDHRRNGWWLGASKRDGALEEEGKHCEWALLFFLWAAGSTLLGGISVLELCHLVLVIVHTNPPDVVLSRHGRTATSNPPVPYF